MTTLFLDESKASGYTIVAAVIVPGDIASFRKAIAELCKPGQRRIHFTKESNSRRKEILSKLAELGVRASIYRVTGLNDRESRAMILAAIAADVVLIGATRILIERDDSIVDQDRRTLFKELDALGLRDKVSYGHDTSAGELLLCIPDAIAWSYAKGGDWMRRIDPMVIDVRKLR